LSLQSGADRQSRAQLGREEQKDLKPDQRRFWRLRLTIRAEACEMIDKAMRSWEETCLD
jgi:hypothetical protein